MNKSTYKIIRSKLNFNFQPKLFFKQVAGDLALLASMIALFQTPYSVINVFLIPVFMFRQFSILHEAVHGLAHDNGKVNEVIGIFAGAFCLTPFSAWKAAHLQHHYWTGNLTKDPTFAILKTFEQSSTFKKRLIELTWRKGIPLLALLQHIGFWFIYLKNKDLRKNVLSNLIPLSIYLGAMSQMSIFNVVIGIVGVGLYFRMFEDMIVPQHVGMYSDDDHDHRLNSWDQQDITRSWSLAPALEKYVVLNMNYHTEHHLFPDLPWHELKNAHMLLLQEKENLNLVSLAWMSEQRGKHFAEVIIPVPSRKKKAA